MIGIVGILLFFVFIPTYAESSGDLDLEGMNRERRVALVIGNGAYGESPLKNPANDARAMAQALQASGFQVIKRENASRGEMVAAIRRFAQLLTDSGVALVYYAGHGIQVDGRNFLIPIDADIRAVKEVESQAVEAGMILAEMEGANNRVKILIMDACRNNPFSRTRAAAGEGLAPMDAVAGALIAYAAAPGAVASDGQDKNGLYTAMILRHMRTPGMTVERVFKSVRRDVIHISGNQQVPWEASSLVGDFYFQLPLDDSSARKESERLLDQADAALDQNRLEQAIKFYKRAIGVDENRAYAHNNLGLALNEKGDIEEAIAAYQKACQLDPSWSDPQFNLGLALRAKGDLVGAIAAYRTAVRLDNQFSPNYNNLGNALADMGDFVGAMGAFREAVRLNSEYAAPHYNLGNIKAYQGDTAGAIESFQQAVQLNPEWPAPRFNLGIALQLAGRKTQALASLRAYIKLESDPKGIAAANEVIQKMQ